MTIIYHLVYRGKADVFIHQSGAYLASWDLKEASWHGDHMDELLEALDYTVVSVDPDTEDSFWFEQRLPSWLERTYARESP